MTVGTTVPINGVFDGEFEIRQVTLATDMLTLMGAASQSGDYLVGRIAAYEKFCVRADGSAYFGSDTTTGQIVAGGTTMLYGRCLQKTTALTGDLIGVRGNARIAVASEAGTAYGGYFQAGSGSSATGADAVNAGAVYGLLGEVVVAAASATVTLAVGIKASMDIDAATTAITSAVGLWVSVGTGSSQGTHTSSVGALIINEDVQGTGTVCAAGLAIGQISRAIGFTYLIDMNPSVALGGAGTAVACSGHSADIRFSNNAWLVALTTAITANSTTTSAPAGSLGITTHATGNTKFFMSDGTKFQYAGVA